MNQNEYPPQYILHTAWSEPISSTQKHKTVTAFKLQKLKEEASQLEAKNKNVSNTSTIPRAKTDGTDKTDKEKRVG